MSENRLSSPSSSSQDKQSPPRIDANHVEANDKNGTFGTKNSNHDTNNYIVKRERPSRACTQRAAAKIQAAAASEAAAEKKHRKKAALRRGKLKEEVEVAEDEVAEEAEEEENQQCSRIVTPLVGEPEPSQLPRWEIRGMWQLASVLNFLNVFRPLLNVKVEFSVEELETALITPNKTLAEIHIPLLRAIPPITRMALGHSTWVTVLCRKLRDWWHWVAEGEIPIVASHGAEIQAYNELDPAVRVVILKALCDIRVEQDDIRNHIDNSIKQGVNLSAFRKQRIGGDSHGVSYWYEDDPIIGHRLYREIRKVEVTKGKGKNAPPILDSSYDWSTVATNLDEFRDVSEKLFSSRNRTEVSVGKKLINDMLPEIEKVHKRKEKQLKRQHRQALMLDNMVNVDRLVAGRALRDRKKVTYTFDDYDRSIDEALKYNKHKQSSSFEPTTKRGYDMKVETRANGKWGAAPPSHSLDTQHSPKSPDFDAYYDENGDGEEDEERLDRGERRKQRPQRYSAGEFIEEVSDQEPDSDDDIEGEAVYDEEYLRQKKRRRQSSSEDEIPEEEEEEDDDDDYLSPSEDEDSDVPRKIRKLPERSRRVVTKSRSTKVQRFGLRRSERATRNRIDYRQIEMSEESETEKNNGDFDEHSNEGYSTENEETEDDDDDDEQDTDNAEMKSDEHLINEGFSAEENEEEEEEEEDTDNAEMKGDENLNNEGFSMENEETEDEEVMDNPDRRGDERVEEDRDHHHHHETGEKDPAGLPEKVTRSHEDDEDEGERKRQFLDLNELAPGSGFDDGGIQDDETDDL